MSSRSRYRVPPRLAGNRVDRVLAELVPDHSSARLQRLVRRGGVELNGGRLTRSNGTVKTGDLFVVDFAALDRGGPDTAADEPFTVLFEDEHVLLVDKAAGCLVHDNERMQGNTLASLADERFGPLPALRGEYRPGIVHRLDRETSGVMVLARRERAMRRLLDAFAARRVSKTYLALVHGEPETATFDVEDPLEPEPGHVDRQRVARSDEGKPARTRFCVLESFGDFSLVECRPTTGRRHQIRVHLASRGHVIVDDRLYGSSLREAPPGAPWPTRHMLHARALEFNHPFEEEPVRFEAPIPGDLRRFVDWLRGTAH